MRHILDNRVAVVLFRLRDSTSLPVSPSTKPASEIPGEGMAIGKKREVTFMCHLGATFPHPQKGGCASTFPAGLASSPPHPLIPPRLGCLPQAPCTSGALQGLPSPQLSAPLTQSFSSAASRPWGGLFDHGGLCYLRWQRHPLDATPQHSTRSPSSPGTLSNLFLY